MTNELMRDDFEAWFTQTFDDKPLWDAARNCYVEHSHHMSWKGWQAATLAAAQQWLPIADAPESPIDLLALSQMGRVSVQTGWALLNMLADANDNDEECMYKGWLPLPPTAKPQGTGGNV